MFKLNKYLLFMPILLLFSVCFASAYDISNLKHYYSFEDVSTSLISDSYSSSNFTLLYSIYNSYIFTGGLYNNGLSRTTTGGNDYFSNMTLLNDYSINFWFKSNGLGGTIISLTNQSNNAQSSNSINYQLVPTSSLASQRNYSSGVTSFIISNISSTTNFNMLTITWKNNTKILRIYQNGIILAIGNLSNGTRYKNNGSLFIDQKRMQLQFSGTPIIDEMSVWNIELDEFSVSNLYNNGDGYDYNYTILGNNISPPTNINHTFDGYYHNYCWFYINCVDYNVSNQVCDDDVYKVCTLSCADNFDSYASVGLENQTASFSAQCYNDTSYYQYPSYVGINGSLIYNYCFGEYLCKTLNVTANNTCPDYWNGQPNKIDCRQQTGSLVAECFDTYTYYTGLGTYPPNNDYTGYCSECETDCLTENATSCYDINTVQRCQIYRSCLKQFSIETCSNTQYCSLGQCIKNISQSSINQVTNPCTTGSYTLGCGISNGIKYIMVLITILIIIGSFTAIGYTMNMIQGSFTVGVIVAFFALIMFTVFGWLPAWILVALLIVGIATIILVSKTGNNASG